MRRLLHLPADADALDVLHATTPMRFTNAVSVIYLQLGAANIARAGVDGAKIVGVPQGYDRRAAVTVVQTTETSANSASQLVANGFRKNGADGYVLPGREKFDRDAGGHASPGLRHLRTTPAAALDAANFVVPSSTMSTLLHSLSTPVRSARVGTGCLRNTTFATPVMPDTGVLTLAVKGTAKPSHLRGSAFALLAKTWKQTAATSGSGHHLTVQLAGDTKNGGEGDGMLLSQPDQYRC